MIKEFGLVDIAKAFPQVFIDLKYATPDNISGRAIYSRPICLLHSDAAQALHKSIKIAELAGLKLLILDAYRPQKAQEILWKACPNQDYVVPTSLGSNHTRGTAIDVTLIDIDGQIINMGTDFDDMDEKSHPFHPEISVECQRNRLLLNAIMIGGGFVGITTEWWHFELPLSVNYPLIEDVFTCN